MFMAEVLFRALREGTEETGMYDWCREEILLLDRLESDYSNFHLRFLLDFAAACGFRPSEEALSAFAGEDWAKIAEILGCDAASSLLVPLNGAQRNRICGRLLKYLEFNMDIRLNIRSLSVLSELFV